MIVYLDRDNMRDTIREFPRSISHVNAMFLREAVVVQCVEDSIQ